MKRRPQFEMRHIIEFSKNRDFTDIMVINEDRKEPSMFSVMSGEFCMEARSLLCLMD